MAMDTLIESGESLHNNFEAAKTKRRARKKKRRARKKNAPERSIRDFFY